MIKIRLSRRGSKKKPFYHIVVADVRAKRDGKYIEKLGYYDPMRKNTLNIMKERCVYWKKMGAQTSKKVKFLIKKY